VEKAIAAVATEAAPPHRGALIRRPAGSAVTVM
jgi:hypothetical protein